MSSESQSTSSSNRLNEDQLDIPSNASTVGDESCITTDTLESNENGDGISVVDQGEIQESTTELETAREGLGRASCTGEIKKDADELLKEGKAFLKSGENELAVEKFSEAVEKKLNELGIADSEHHPSLGPFYLEYGNGLLKCAENSNELFKFTEQSEVSQSSHQQQTINENLENMISEAANTETVSDEQLAWEVLELARICYSVKLAELENNEEIPNPTSTEARQAVEDAAFVHLRLGDLLIVEEKFIEAAEEYQNSLVIMNKNHLPYTYRLSSTIALGQAQLFSGKVQESLETFKDALNLVTNQLNGVEGATVPDERAEDFKATQEDLMIQISELERNIRDGVYDDVKDPSSSSTLQSSFSERTFLQRTGVEEMNQSLENPFVPSQLKLESGETVLGVVLGKRAQAKIAAKEAENVHANHGSDLTMMQHQVFQTAPDMKKRQRLQLNKELESDIAVSCEKSEGNYDNGSRKSIRLCETQEDPSHEMLRNQDTMKGNLGR